jgi:hypothetical protein
MPCTWVHVMLRCVPRSTHNHATSASIKQMARLKTANCETDRRVRFTITSSVSAFIKLRLNTFIFPQPQPAPSHSTGAVQWTGARAESGVSQNAGRCVGSLGVRAASPEAACLATASSLPAAPCSLWLKVSVDCVFGTHKCQ